MKSSADVIVDSMQEMSESAEQHRILSEQKAQLTAELAALSDSMDRVCCRCSYCDSLYCEYCDIQGGPKKQGHLEFLKIAQSKN